jgi:hypothetical protein
MKANQPRPQVMRSVGAVVAGALTGIVLSIGTDSLLHAAGWMPAPEQPASPSLLLAATAYRTIYGVLGAWITARFSPYRPFRHVTVLGSLGLLATLFGAIATWNKRPAIGLHWYPVTLNVLALPTAWLGGWLCVRQTEPSVSAPATS